MFLLFFFYQIRFFVGFLKLDGESPLKTDPPPTSPTTLSKKEKRKHLTPDTWHVTPNTWHVTRGWGQTFSKKFSSWAGCNYVWRFGGKGLENLHVPFTEEIGKNVGFSFFRFFSEHFCFLQIFFEIWNLPSQAPTNHPMILLGILGLVDLKQTFSYLGKYILF